VIKNLDLQAIGGEKINVPCGMPQNLLPLSVAFFNDNVPILGITTGLLKIVRKRSWSIGHQK
jgi:hypothetical protein